MEISDHEPSSGVVSLLAGSLPYPDPRRRRAARRAAEKLIDCEPWPGDDATPLEISQLALLQLLHLQCEAHRCTRRQREAVALLVRAAVETAITGLYWLYGEQDIKPASSENAKSFRRLMAPLADEESISEEMIEEAAATIGSGRGLPNLRDMAELVSERSGRTAASDLYHRVYIPLSTFVAHPSGMALLRHVASDDELSEAPSSIWSRRSALHAADACMGLLALELAEQKKRPAAMLTRYADAHMGRTIAPLAILLGGAMLRNLRPHRLARALRPMAELWRYYRLGRAALDPYPERETRINELLSAVLAAFGGEGSAAEEAIARHYAADLARSADEPDRGGRDEHG
jgi:hypothetical protein